MEFIIEFILELCFEIGLDKKVSKWIRYPLLFILILVYLGLIALFIWLGLTVAKTNMLLGIGICAITVILAIVIIFVFRKKYKELNSYL